MVVKLIVARNFKEAHAFANEELGLNHGHYRVVTSPGTIRAIRGAEVYLVPGWDKRPDRFSMKSALKFCRHTVIDVAEQRKSAEQVAPVVPEPVTDGLNPPGIQTAIDDDEASAFLSVDPEPAPDRTTLMQEMSDEVAVTEDAAPVVEKPQWQIDLDSQLEPVGFALSNDPAVQTQQILQSAAAEGEKVLAEEPAPEKPKRIRRKKCPECQELILPAEFDEHLSTHAAAE